MLKVLHVAIYLDGGRGSCEAKINSKGFFGAKNCTSLAQARDAFIKQYRAEYKEDLWEPGSESPASLIYKFPFRNELVGYYHFDDGLSFVFGEDHPVYKLVQSKNYTDDDLAEKLYDLFLYHDEIRDEKRRARKLAA